MRQLHTIHRARHLHVGENDANLLMLIENGDSRVRVLRLENTPFRVREIGEFNDVEVHGQWKDDVETGKVPAASYLRDIAQTSRDNARTPMQWSSLSNAGFTRGKPWIPVNPNFNTINVATQTSKNSSVLGFYRRLICWRLRHPDLAASGYVDILPDHPALFVYRRGSVFVAINFSRHVQQVTVTGKPTVMLTSDDDGVILEPNNLTLPGWTEAILSVP
jgi:oligo-1,6-glucosidase